MTPEEAKRLEKRVDELRADLKTIDAAHLDRYHSLKTDTDAVKLLIDGHRRMEAALTEHDDRLTDVERTCGQGRAQADRHGKRLDALEGMNIAVLVDRFDRFEKHANVEIAAAKRLLAWTLGSFATLILTIIGGILIFLVSQGAQ